MKKAILLIIATTCFFFGYSQNENSVKNYRLGSKALDHKKYPEAISLLTLSIIENPTANAYFNRAVAYYYLGDSCNFCGDLKTASMLKDSEAKDMFDKRCTITLIDKNVPKEIKIKYPLIRCFIIVRNKCDTDSTIYYNEEYKGISKTEELSKIEYQDYHIDTVPIYTIVEEMPMFPGGNLALSQYLRINLTHSGTELKCINEGNIYVSFIVEADGSISHVKVLRGVGGNCDEEAMRVVKLMPKWNPGRQNGKNVRVLFNIPISFTLSR